MPQVCVWQDWPLYEYMCHSLCVCVSEGTHLCMHVCPCGDVEFIWMEKFGWEMQTKVGAAYAFHFATKQDFHIFRKSLGLAERGPPSAQESD